MNLHKEIRNATSPKKYAKQHDCSYSYATNVLSQWIKKAQTNKRVYENTMKVIKEYEALSSKQK